MDRVAEWALVWFVCYALIGSYGSVTHAADLAMTLFVVLGATAYTTVLTVVLT